MSNQANSFGLFFSAALCLFQNQPVIKTQGSVTNDYGHDSQLSLIHFLGLSSAGHSKCKIEEITDLHLFG